MSELIYFKRFSTKTDYDTYINGSPVLPNVSFVDMDVYYKDGNLPPTPPHHDYSKDYLTFNITSDGDISWGCIGESAATIEYKKNDGEWTEITATPLDPQEMTGGTKINVVAGDIVQFRGDNDTYLDMSMGEVIGCFAASTAGFTLEGNIMSLIDSVNYEEMTTMTSNNAGAFYAMFEGCTGLTSAENLILPATILAVACYLSMFYGCTSLVSAPELPATTLADYCYYYMFDNCSSLTSAPELPATTLAEQCYSNMFGNCYNLTTVPSSIGTSATTMANSACTHMFYECTSLTTAPELPATTLAEGCYQRMFEACTSLTTAPSILPATTLASGCYDSMFLSCTGLTKAPALPATTLADDCYYGMFSNCYNLTTAPSLPATTLTQSCYQSMFDDCTSLTSAPELPATTLASNCYYKMFEGCKNLNYIKCLATDISASNCTSIWVSGVASTGTFVKAASMTSWPTGISGIPEGWTVQDAA